MSNHDKLWSQTNNKALTENKIIDESVDCP